MVNRGVMCASLQMPAEDYILKEARSILEEYYYIESSDEEGWAEVIEKMHMALEKVKGTDAGDFARDIMLTVLARLEGRTSENS